MSSHSATISITYRKQLLNYHETYKKYTWGETGEGLKKNIKKWSIIFSRPWSIGLLKINFTGVWMLFFVRMPQEQERTILRWILMFYVKLHWTWFLKPSINASAKNDLCLEPLSNPRFFLIFFLTLLPFLLKSKCCCPGYCVFDGFADERIRQAFQLGKG